MRCLLLIAILPLAVFSCGDATEAQLYPIAPAHSTVPYWTSCEVSESLYCWVEWASTGCAFKAHIIIRSDIRDRQEGAFVVVTPSDGSTCYPYNIENGWCNPIISALQENYPQPGWDHLYSGSWVTLPSAWLQGFLWYRNVDLDGGPVHWAHAYWVKPTCTGKEPTPQPIIYSEP